MLTESQELRSEAISEFVRKAKPRTMRGLLDMLVWGWLMMLVSLAIYICHPSVLTFAIAFLAVTSRMGALLAIAHDAQHNAFLPNKKWNDLIAAWLCAYPMGSIYGSSRAVHMAHHKLLNTPLDPDRNFHSEADKNTPAAFAGHFLRMVCGGQLWTSIVVNGFMRTNQKSAVEPTGTPSQVSIADPSAQKVAKAQQPVVVLHRKGHPEIFNLVPVQLVILLTLWAVSHQWWLYFAIWLGPIFTFGTFLGFLRGFVDHARLQSDCPVQSAHRLITVTHTNVFERFFLGHFDFKYHAEHHMFPSVPHYYLPELHSLLHADEGYRSTYLVRHSYFEFLGQYWAEISRGTMNESAMLEKKVT
jgi:fatty acid desaturase